MNIVNNGSRYQIYGEDLRTMKTLPAEERFESLNCMAAASWGQHSWREFDSRKCMEQSGGCCNIRRSCADKHGVSKGARTHNNLPTVLQNCSPDSGRDYWGIVKR